MSEPRRITSIADVKVGMVLVDRHSGTNVHVEAVETDCAILRTGSFRPWRALESSLRSHYRILPPAPDPWIKGSTPDKEGWYWVVAEYDGKHSVERRMWLLGGWALHFKNDGKVIRYMPCEPMPELPEDLR